MIDRDLIALDLGSSLGWARRRTEGDTTIAYGSEMLKPSRWESIGFVGIRFKQTLERLRADRPCVVLFEEVRRHLGTDAAHAYGRFHGWLCEWCDTHGVAYRSVPVSDIKKFATGKGNANKEAMIAAMVKRGYAPANDDEADALALLHWGLENL